MLNRYGTRVYMRWSYDPKENKEAHDKALKKLQFLGVENAEVYEVAPEVFWYKTPKEEINCSTYDIPESLDNSKIA